MTKDRSDCQQIEDSLKVALDYAENIIATLREPFVVLNRDLRVKTANRSFFESFHVSKEETENRLVYDLGNGQWDIPLLRMLLNQVLARRRTTKRTALHSHASRVLDRFGGTLLPRTCAIPFHAGHGVRRDRL